MLRAIPFRVVSAVVFCAIGVALAPPAHAHLSIIRQQYESSGDVEPGDRLGRALAAGDFNGDGFEDLAMGAPEESEDVLDVALHGAVCINYGTAFGLTHLSPTYLSLGAPDDQLVNFGFSLAVGDFDNDGYDDLAVGAPNLDDELNNVNDAGAVFIYRGGALGLAITPAQSLFQTTAGGPPQGHALLGYSLAAGDFNNDSYDDLAAGAIGIDLGAGQVFHYFFTAGLQILAQGTLQQSDLGYTDEPGSQFGWSLAAAPFVDPPGDELAIGTPGRTLPDAVRSGRVYVVPGSATGFVIPLRVIHDRHLWGAPHSPEDRFGHALVAGKFLVGAAHPALAIGEPGAQLGGLDDAGRVSVLENVFGGVIPNYITFAQSTGNSGPLTDEGDQFGYSLAAGFFGPDDKEDLAVGSPFDDVTLEGITYPDAGIFQIFPGGAGFPNGDFASAYTARTVNDAITSGANLGYALAFGTFDKSDSANLAIGAPDHEWTNFLLGPDIPRAGQVHILAPHRQIENRQNRASIGVDCAGNIIYSQRMFHPMPIASITKIMTVLLACEAIDDGIVTEDSVYTVPDWLAEDMPYGSKYGVLVGERLTLRQLMLMTVMISANDGAWAIGDLLTGADNQWDDNESDNTNWATVLSDFANRMNIRADEIGMTRTTYVQPAGSIPLGTAWSCAYDQYLLAKEAMNNARFRDVVATLSHVWLMDVPNEDDAGIAALDNSFLSGLQSYYPTADGLKPGSTPDARHTGVASAPIGSHRIFATVLGVPDTSWGDPITGNRTGTLADLLNLVDNKCDSVTGWPGAPPPGHPAPPLHSQTGIPTHADSTASKAHVEHGGEHGDLVVELKPTSGSPCAEVTVKRAGEVAIPPAANHVYRFETLDSHLGFRITNRDTIPAELTIALSHPTLSLVNQTLAPESTLVLPAYAGPPGPQLTLGITNAARGTTALLDVEETGYRYVGPIPSLFARTMNRQIGNLTVTVAGCDTVPGGTLVLVIRDADHPVLEVPLPVDGSVSVPLIHSSAPNPFVASTEIRFESPEKGPVEVLIYDISGRLVRNLHSTKLGLPGSHRITWNGRNLDGRRVNPGVYLYRVRVGNRTGSGKMTVLE